jgi:hypothetical protein
MTRERAYSIVIDAATERWMIQSPPDPVLREALDTVLQQVGETTRQRALALKWREHAK